MWINGYNREKFLSQLQEKNGFNICTDILNLCAYRGVIDSNGKMGGCFVGAFIPDEKYSVLIEGDSVDMIYDGLEDFMPLPLDQMIKLQTLHDTNINDDLKYKVIEFLDKEGL